LTALDDSRDSLVGDRHGVLNSALALELEPHLRSHYGDMSTTQRGEPEGLVGLSVFVGADANQSRFEQPHYGGHNLVASEAGQRDVRFHSLSDLPEHIAELEHALELRAI